MEKSEPKIRSYILKDLFAGLSGSPHRQEILQSLEPGLVEKFESASALSWQPAAHLLAFVNAIGKFHSPGEVSELCYKGSLKIIENPLTRGPMEMAVKMFGLTPRGLIKTVPAMWKLHYANIGEVAVTEKAHNEVDLCWSQVPPTLLANNVIYAFQGGMRVLLAFCKAQGTVQIRQDMPARSVIYNFKWN
jgi:hypothetical protein